MELRWGSLGATTTRALPGVQKTGRNSPALLVCGGGQSERLFLWNDELTGAANYSSRLQLPLIGAARRCWGKRTVHAPSAEGRQSLSGGSSNFPAESMHIFSWQACFLVPCLFRSGWATRGFSSQGVHAMRYERGCGKFIGEAMCSFAVKNSLKYIAPGWFALLF